jgi:hypothetical protein
MSILRNFRKPSRLIRNPEIVPSNSEGKIFKLTVKKVLIG